MGPIEEIRVVRLGMLVKDISAELAGFISRRFHCRMLPTDTMPLPSDGWDPVREQHQAGALLDYLAASVPPPGCLLLGVTERDLWLPGMNYVFGAAQPNGCVAVISLARLREEFYGRPADLLLFLLRGVKEGVHELGHSLGLGHCGNPRCIMFFSNSLADTDRKGPGFCDWCREILDGGERGSLTEGPFGD